MPLIQRNSTQMSWLIYPIHSRPPFHLTTHLPRIQCNGIYIIRVFAVCLYQPQMQILIIRLIIKNFLTYSVYL